MKKLLVLAVLLFASTASTADVYYAVNKRGEVVAKSKVPFTNVSSLESRGEKQVVSAVDLDIDDAIVDGNMITVRPKSQAEKNAEKIELGLKAEEKLVSDRMRKIAIDSLKSEGVKFKYIEEGV